MTRSHGIPVNTNWVTERGGGDGYRYIIRVADLNKYLPNIYPDAPHTGVPDVLDWYYNRNEKTVFVLTDCDWEDATGHFDFSANKQRVSGYFKRCQTLAVYRFTYVKCIGKTEEDGIHVWTFHHVLQG